MILARLREVQPVEWDRRAVFLLRDLLYRKRMESMCAVFSVLFLYFFVYKKHFFTLTIFCIRLLSRYDPSFLIISLLVQPIRYLRWCLIFNTQAPCQLFF